MRENKKRDDHPGKNGVVKKDPIILRRSNALIEAKFSSTLLEKKLVALALTRVTQRNNKMVAIMSAGDIREALGISGNGIYDQLKMISEATVQHFLVLEDDRKAQRFDIISIIERAQYDDGILTFTFNDEIRKHTIDVTRRFTLTSLSTLLSFRSNNTYRLYELLMIHYFKIPDDGVFEVQYGLAELRFLIGLVDTNKPEVTRALRANRDYEDVLENVIKDYKYKEWTNFKARVLEQARKEMEKSELSEITFEYSPVRQHRGGRTTGVKFYLRKHGTVRPPEKIIDVVSNDDINELMNISDGEIDNVTAETLLRAAHNDIERVKRVYAELKIRTGIANPTGWMLRAITEGWKFEDLKKDKGKKTHKNTFSNIEEHDYNYDEIEKMLLKKNMQVETEPVEETDVPIIEEEQIDGQMTLSDYFENITEASSSEDTEEEKEINEEDIDNMSIEELKALLKKKTRTKK